jgi:cob(I)alamin adenosyltransferase
MKIYTKAGDDGHTGLFGAGRVAKDDLRIEAIGTLDELSAAIGLVRSSDPDVEPVHDLLRTIQDDLFVVGAQLASPLTPCPSSGTIVASDVQRLETAIDQFDAQLPPLRQFILPGGSAEGAQLHLARVVCRRAERRLVALSHHAELPDFVLPYLNRLSDLLFVLARWVNQQMGMTERPWQQRGVSPSK